jgi:hypothetical protein
MWIKKTIFKATSVEYSFFFVWVEKPIYKLANVQHHSFPPMWIKKNHLQAQVCNVISLKNECFFKFLGFLHIRTRTTNYGTKDLKPVQFEIRYQIFGLFCILGLKLEIT